MADYANIESLSVAWINNLGVIPLIGTLQESRIRNIADSFRIDLEHEDWPVLGSWKDPGWAGSLTYG